MGNANILPSLLETSESYSEVSRARREDHWGEANSNFETGAVKEFREIEAILPNYINAWQGIFGGNNLFIVNFIFIHFPMNSDMNPCSHFRPGY